METTKNAQLTKLGNWTRNDGTRYEMILLLLALLAIVLRYFNNGFAGILLIISVSALAIFYYLSAYSSVEEDIEVTMKIFVNRLGGWGSSIGLIGILFVLMSYEGSRVMLISGGLISISAAIAGFYIRRKSPDSQIINTKFITRTTVIALIAILLCVTPKQTLIDMNLIKSPNNTVNIK